MVAAVTVWDSHILAAVTPGSVCVQDSDGELTCGVPPASTFSSTITSISPNSLTGTESSTSILPSSSTTSPTATPTPTSPTSLTPGTSFTINPDDPSIHYSPDSSSWTPPTQDNLPVCAKNTDARSTSQSNATISFKTTATRVFVRTVNSPQGGSYTISFGNHTQNFTSHSDTPSCDNSSSVQTLLQSTWSHVLASGDVPQEVVITNGESTLTFIDIVVSLDADGPMVVLPNGNDLARADLRLAIPTLLVILATLFFCIGI
ncbi:hypothetical protein K435DRAFT_962716 [Dendrothele bispora CBS 962.96]|uniref:Uncharacterized protein n=1 Tax=Dendrothele bispora (strain CBS 962.96) TaxID=1314807 RepID=A0A4S8MJS9_DENBC|nr:hypothetical protein K435DRAFT_962716 [Dendrothele bispora CBS 962.96]